MTGNLAGMMSECGNLTIVSPKPNSSVIITDVGLHGLWSSNDGTANWTQMGLGAGSAMITNRPSSIVYDPANSDVFWESGIWSPGIGGVYRTTDGGKTFALLGNITHIDLVSIDFTDPLRQTLWAGGHESNKFYRSTDGGEHWTRMGDGRVGYMGWPLVLDANVHLIGGTNEGILRTTDGGKNWKRVYEGGVRSAPLVAADGAIYWILYPGTLGMVRSTDGGASWKGVAPTGVLVSVEQGPIELPDGRLVAVGNSSLMQSRDQGASWQRIGPARFPFKPWSVTYSTHYKAFYIWHWSCDGSKPTPVPADAIMRVGFDYKVE
jgi:photosystem II stability/assembly factor-like uncharacterized protein